MENNIDEDENLELDASPVNLNDEIESEDEELPPPEEEKDEARELNVGNILALIFIGVAVIFLIVMAAGSAKSKKKIQSRELDKSGSKTAIEFKERTEKAPDVKDDVQQIFEEEKKGDMPMSEKDADDVLSTLPPELQSGTAPVTSVGSRSASSAKSDRPDTRNSKSPRKIEGIAGQNYAAANANSNIVSAVMNGNFPQMAASSRMTKEEYIAQQMQRTQQIQNSLYGSSGSYGGTSQSQSAAYQSNREEFFNNQGSGTGNGQFLPYNTLWDGTIISGALVTAINTDNPGVVIARVTQNVYSSYDHSLLLIPEGSLLYATYNSSVSYGQNKVQVAWNLLIRPDGYRISLGNMNGV
ncbi:TrbI/VirB10 family protein, partial [uncultured Treponema sp.]|uniref:TrbI/VirB10 family protein n=1 Tax=uncultured Treponema sp. TaxID=162155 RepID=UPI00260D0A27